MYTKTINDRGEFLTFDDRNSILNIPMDVDNRHYKEFLAWKENGGEETVIDERISDQEKTVRLAKSKIQEIENTQDRAVREALLLILKSVTPDVTNTKLHEIENMIIEERGKING